MSRRHFILGLTLAATVNVAILLAMWRSNPDAVPDRRSKAGSGSAEEAFDMACRTIKDYLPSIGSDPVLIDPQFRATLLSQSKIWTIKGYASCPNSDSKSYGWIVILNYHDMQEWEILAKIVTPEISAADTNQIEGLPKPQGKLLKSDGDHYRNRD